MAIFKRRFKAPSLGAGTDLSGLLAEGKPVLIDFMKHGCQPCQVMDGIVDEVADSFQEEAIVVKANLAQVPELFERFKIRSTPTFVLISPRGDGLHQRWRHSGLVKKDVIVTNVERAVRSG